MFRRCALFGLLITHSVAWGCGDALVGPGDDPALRTDRTEYLAERIHPDGERREFEIIATYENRTPRNVYLSRCGSGPIYGIAVADGEERVAYNPTWGCGLATPFTIEPGTARVDTLHVEGPNSIPAEGILEGEFQLFYRVWSCPETVDQGCLLPEHLLVSNVFSVRLADE